MRHNGPMSPLIHPLRAAATAFGLMLLGWLVTLSNPVFAQDFKPVYRCPGPPVLYTDALTLVEARERGCRGIEGAPITIVQTPRAVSKPASGAPSTTSATAPTPVAGGRPTERVDPAAQRARDSDARRILGDELRREEERLALLQRDFNNGEPERRGDERNAQKYLDRVAEMKASIARKEADIAAIKREIGKLPQ